MSLSGFEKVCSNRTPARTATSRGNQHWIRDPHHLRMDKERLTLCGIDCSDWLVMGDADLREELESKDLCKRCHSALLK